MVPQTRPFSKAMATIDGRLRPDVWSRANSKIHECLSRFHIPPECSSSLYLSEIVFGFAAHLMKL
jgi:hypothetical protein